MKVKFSKLAWLEFQESIVFYEFEMKGLGDRFKQDVYEMLEIIAQFPLMGQVESKRIRRMMLMSFPFKILYAFVDNIVYIVAIASQHRRPDYWVERSL
ncbi:MAG: type II toxin-antitoxin system RelE/ParE family toxin [Candidatus Margulisiibacteriota bacterium]